MNGLSYTGNRIAHKQQCMWMARPQTRLLELDHLVREPFALFAYGGVHGRLHGGAGAHAHKQRASLTDDVVRWHSHVVEKHLK